MGDYMDGMGQDGMASVLGMKEEPPGIGKRMIDVGNIGWRVCCRWCELNRRYNLYYSSFLFGLLCTLCGRYPGSGIDCHA